MAFIKWKGRNSTLRPAFINLYPRSYYNSSTLDSSYLLPSTQTNKSSSDRYGIQEDNLGLAIKQRREIKGCIFHLFECGEVVEFLCVFQLFSPCFRPVFSLLFFFLSLFIEGCFCSCLFSRYLVCSFETT